MMSSQPTTQPRMYETILNPYPRSHIMAPGSQQPVSFIHLGNQAQSGQPPFFGSPGIITNSQQGPVNTQVVNPATGTETTNFREDAKILGVSLLTMRILILNLQGYIVLLSYRWRDVFDLMTYIQSLKSSVTLETVSL